MQDVHAFGPQLRDIASELLLNGVKEDDARLLAALEPSTASWIDSEAALGLERGCVCVALRPSGRAEKTRFQPGTGF
jgi:hypothetical protein